MDVAHMNETYGETLWRQFGTEIVSSLLGYLVW
jgi:hypothetical protein